MSARHQHNALLKPAPVLSLTCIVACGSSKVCAGDARVKALIDGTYTRKDMFDELQADVYAKLNNEVFPRFLNSSEGGHLVKRKQ